MNELISGLVKILSSKDGPLILGLTAITTLTLGWKFFDSGYRIKSEGWEVYRSEVDTKDENAGEEKTYMVDPDTAFVQ